MDPALMRLHLEAELAQADVARAARASVHAQHEAHRAQAQSAAARQRAQSALEMVWLACARERVPTPIQMGREDLLYQPRTLRLYGRRVTEVVGRRAGRGLRLRVTTQYVYDYPVNGARWRQLGWTPIHDEHRRDYFEDATMRVHHEIHRRGVKGWAIILRIPPSMLERPPRRDGRDRDVVAQEAQAAAQETL